MNTNKLTTKSKVLIALLAIAANAHAGTTQLSNSPLSGASSVEINPNIMFILDDSLSMSWDYLPDWAGGKNNTNPLMTIPIALWQSRNSSFNGVAYNPGITYSPPINYNSDGTQNTTTYPTQNATNTSNWTAVKRNPYLTNTVDNLVGSAYYYSTVPGEFCSNASMRSCSTTSTSIPAKLRWCNSASEAIALTPSTNACQATEINNEDVVDVFGYPRMPAPRTSTISITASGAVSSITVDGKQLLSAAVPSQPDAATLVAAVVDSINACTYSVIAPLATYCQVGGYKAAAGTNSVTIYAPGTTALTPAITASPTLSATAFGRPSNNLAPGENLLTVITSSTTTYPKGEKRGDCAGASCTYDEEMTNYANWWAYYHTRMQSMKTAASRAFAPLDLNYRVGLMSIDNNTGTSSMGSSFLNVTTFNTAQKLAWYNKLFNAVPTAETPLRLALAQAGRIYAGKLTGSFNGQPAIVDPVQFSCQQNVAILSTDGYWNDAAGFKLDGSSAVGDQDGPAITTPAVVIRPQLDGGAPIYAKSTEQISQVITPSIATQLQQKVDTIQSQQRSLQISTKTQNQSQESNLQATISTLQFQSAPLQSETSQLRTRTRQLQESLQVATVSTLTAFNSRNYQILKSTLAADIQSKTQALQYKKSVLQQQTAALQISTSTLQSATSQLQTRTYPLQQRLTQVQQRTSSNSGTTWSAWSNTSTCIPVVNEKECKLLPISSWNSASSCTPVPQPGASNPEVKNPGTDSQYQLYTTVAECQYGSVTAWSNVSSCTPITKSSGTGTWSVGTAAECQYTAWTTPSNATTCTPLAQSTGTGTWSIGTATQCSYTTPTSYANATGTCTIVPQSSGTGTWNTATAVNCQYASYTAAATTTSCTPASKSTGSPYTQLTARTCSYAAYDSSWQMASAACTVKAQSSGTGEWTGPAMQCRYNPTIVGWNTGLSSCTKTSAGDLASFAAVTAIVDCQTINVWSTPANAPSCTTNATTACTTTTPTAWAGPITSCTASTSGTGLVTECQAAWTTPVIGACTPSPTTSCGTTWGPWNNVTTCDNNGTTSQCQYLAVSGYSNVNSPSTCTIKTASTGTGTWTGPVRECNYPGTWTTATNDATCSPAAKSTGTADGTVFSVNIAKRCLYGNYGSWTNATGTCTTVPASSSAPYTAAAISCRYLDGSASVVSSCTPSNKTAASPYTTLTATACGYSGYGAWTDVSTCATVPQSTSAPYNATARNCTSTWTPYANTSSCTAVANNTQCQYGTASWVKTPGGCTVLAGSTGPSYTVETATLACGTTPVSGWTNTTGCTSGPDSNNDAVSCQTVFKPTTSSFVATCTDVADDGTPEHNAITCPKATTGPINISTCTNVAPTAPNYVKTICTETTEGSTSDTLADVAQYYYMTDLRDSSLSNCTGFGGNDVCENNVLPSGESKADWQHMTTYTLGLGASGLMQYNKDYLKASVTDGDFYSIKEGLTADTATGVCPWQTRGACNWPKPISNTQTNIDDLWHAAVNGRGTYFSASDPESLAAGISGALASIGEKPGSLAAVAVTNPNLVAGDNGFFEVQFKAGEWSGDVRKRTINGTTGVLSSATNPVWSAQGKLDAKTTARNIYTYNAGGTANLKAFSWTELTAPERAFFTKPNIAPLSQFCSTGPSCLSAATQTSSEGEPLVDFLRGDKSHEGALDNLGAYYRQRAHLLGDIVGSEAVYVKGSPWNYADNGYSAFKAANTDDTSTSKRKGMVYIAANDGMLHAFDADTGEEDWAYVPAIVMPTLFRLADKNYPSLSPVMHRFNVDGTPVMGDICASNCSTTPEWKTILVGGLNNGGRGYYALDITDPTAPKALWEFTNTNLGNTYGNPVITKLTDGTWVTIVSSGYNNVSPGDGQGYLYVLNANSGALIRTIPTYAGDTTTPSGLSRITAWANFPDNNNTAQRVYGGDLLGNLWRFDINSIIPSPTVPPAPAVYDAQRLATLKDASGVAQPITSKPELGKINNFPIVFVGTGQLLGSDDLATTQTQSLYAIKDRLTDTDYGSPRPLTPPQTTPVPGDFVRQTLTADVCGSGKAFCAAGELIVTSSKNPVDFVSQDGWYTDFPVDGERVNTDLRLTVGTLSVNTNTPKSGACVPVGVSYTYDFDYRSGGSFDDDTQVGVKLGDFLASSSTPVRLATGEYKKFIGTDLPGSKLEKLHTNPTPPPTRRISWRELITE